MLKFSIAKVLRIASVLALFLGLALVGVFFWDFIPAPVVASDPSAYVSRAFHDPDGIGRFYHGREIAQVMGHRGAGWLERASRQSEEQPDVLVELLDLQPTDQVADIGAGTGYLSFRLAAKVPEGQVWAVDVQPEMIAILSSLAQRYAQDPDRGPVIPVLGTEPDPQLPPESCDLVLMVDAYHEFAYPREMMQALQRSLKPGGRVVLAEYRGEDPWLPIKRVHKMREAQVRRELEFLGFHWLKTDESLPQQHLLFFEKIIDEIPLDNP